MNAARYLLIFCLLTAQVDDLWTFVSVEESQTDSDADDDDYSLAHRQDEWLSASLRRQPVPSTLQRPISDRSPHLPRPAETSSENRGRPGSPSILYLFMSLQR